MPIGFETECTIRIAMIEELLIKGFEVTQDTKLEDIPVTEIMEVELFDFSDSKNFEIKSFSSHEQTIIENNYTEWLFFVKPLEEGIHTLFLKVNVIQYIRDKERKREEVFKLKINVISKLKDSTTVSRSNIWKDTNIYVSLGENKQIIPFPQGDKLIRFNVFKLTVAKVIFIGVALLAVTIFIMYFYSKLNNSVILNNQLENVPFEKGNFQKEELDPSLILENEISLIEKDTFPISVSTINRKTESLNDEKLDQNGKIKEVEGQKIDESYIQRGKAKSDSDLNKKELNKQNIFKQDSLKIIETEFLFPAKNYHIDSSAKTQILSPIKGHSLIVWPKKSKDDKSSSSNFQLKEIKTQINNLRGKLTPIDTSKVGKIMYLKVTAIGFKNNNLKFGINENQVHQKRQDGQDFYFEFKATEKEFVFELYDFDSKYTIQTRMNGNINYEWIVERNIDEFTKKYRGINKN